ncbi:hypothetical protein AZI86_01320 [Bdellovibrio bacteriovorus]|uniref:Uncharacterized protein n=1 Tax=Bdellovibrio bacteriovorus TaxID=959 RepID=A0A150WMZ4_BDEBC|nr:hypothetical protein [Bdellovibrio bacteriovorus]KYG65744.1 hypothetical protein AZI86_01320 [Bdellovibrio bacteriovorus]
MISKLFRFVVLTLAVGFPLHSLAADCPRGQLCNIFERILDNKGGPFAGVASGGGGNTLSNLQFQQKAICEMPGAKCTDEQRLGCSRITASVISGYVECWAPNDKNFKLMDRKTGNTITNRSYDVVANLDDNNTDHKLIVAKSSYYNGAILMNENGDILADGESLDCDSFQAAGEGKVACVRGNKKFVLNVDDLEKARRASINVREAADKFAVNLCSISLTDIAAERRKSSFIHRIFMGKKKSFEGVGATPIEVITNDQGKNDLSPSCSLEPDTDKKCTSILLTAKGLECYSFGSLLYVKEMKVSKTELASVAKKYVFKDREIVPMTDIYDMANNVPSYLKITRPDFLLGSTTFITSASRGGSSNQSARRGTN